MTFYRHFCEREDFQAGVITHEPAAAEQSYPSLILPSLPVFDRLTRTRGSRWVHGFDHLFGGRRVPPHVDRFVRSFQPDAIFTVAGAWSSMARLAETVATRFQLPLIGSFNDWWYYNQIYHPVLHSALSRQFLDFYQRCDLAICTSDGIQDAFESHRNSMVLYPTGASGLGHGAFASPSGRPLTVGFGGNLGDWYGGMIESLVRFVEERLPGEFQFRLFGSRPSWSNEFDEHVKQNGTFWGQVDFDTLSGAMRDCDILLLPMGFDAAIREIESTSFKTKFLDYLTFEKPIVVWGPEYCSAVRTAREFDSAEVCLSENPSNMANVLVQLKSDPDRQARLVINSGLMYHDRFHPDRLHSQLVERIKGLISCES